MKLFQQMLVAGASLSMLAPVAAQASDVVNLEEMNSYSRSRTKTSRFDSNTFINDVSEDIANLKGRVDGLEARQNNFEAGSFTDTTTMDGKAVMWIGGVDGGDNLGGNETVGTGYSYTMNLNSSFTGDDNLYVRLKGGEYAKQWGIKETYHIETKGTTDQFKVDKMWYTFPIGGSVTAFAGPRIENYYMYITPSIYKPGALKSMKLGGNSNFGASTDTGFGFKFETENGFGIASNIVSKGSDGYSSKGITATGLLGKDDISKWDTQVAYTTDRWHISATLSDSQNWTSQSYNATAAGAEVGSRTTSDGDATGYAFRGYWMPEESGTAVPEISVGYDIKSADTPNAGAGKEADSYFVGLTWKDMFQADDRIGVAITQPLKQTECNGTCSTAEVDPLVWEAYYAFKPNDSMEVRPAIFGGTDVEDSTEDDIFGAVLTTTFKF